MQNLDHRLFFLLNHLAGRTAWLDILLVGSATLLQYVLVALLAAAWFWPGSATARSRRQELVLLALLTVVLAEGINQVVGALYVRPRPFAVLTGVHLLLPRSPDPSFPSDHATLAAALTLPFLLARERWWCLFALTGMHHGSRPRDLWDALSR